MRKLLDNECAVCPFVANDDMSRYHALIKLEAKAQELVDAMESLPDASAQLLGLKALLKPAEPVYVPLVGDRELCDVGGVDRGLRAVVVLTLRKAADRLTYEDQDDERIARKLRQWADQEEKYNA